MVISAMGDDKKFTVIEMPRISVSTDGEAVELHYKDAGGNSITLSFSGEVFERHSSRAIQVFTHARNQRLSKGDHLAIHPVAAEATAADANIGGGKVLLSIRADNGVPYHFAISPEEAEELRRQLSDAAKSAKKQASESRH